MKYKVLEALDLALGDNRIHFDAGEEKELSLPEGFELPAGFEEAGKVPEKEEKKETKAKNLKKQAKKGGLK